MQDTITNSFDVVLKKDKVNMLSANTVRCGMYGNGLLASGW